MAPAGRPRLGTERRQRYNVMLEPGIAGHIRQLGNGNLSAGIYQLVEQQLAGMVRKVKRSAARRVATKTGAKS